MQIATNEEQPIEHLESWETWKILLEVSEPNQRQPVYTAKKNDW
jgi:hypothetical protein